MVKLQRVTTAIHPPARRNSTLVGYLNSVRILQRAGKTIIYSIALTLSGCAVLEHQVTASPPPTECASAMVTMPATLPAAPQEFAWLPPPPQTIQTETPKSCRPMPAPGPGSPGGVEPAFFPSDPPSVPRQCGQECLDLRALEQSFLERSNAIEQRLGQRIEALETELQQSRAEALTLKSQLEQATNLTASLERDVDSARLEVERIHTMFLEQQAQDLESLEKLTNMLRILLVRPELVQQQTAAAKETR